MSDNLSRSYIGSVVLGLALAGGAGLCLYLLMRKEEDWEGKEQEGVTSKQVSLEMKIPKDSVGIVIGRQGSNIKYGAVMKYTLYVLCVQRDYGEDKHKDQL